MPLRKIFKKLNFFLKKRIKMAVFHLPQFEYEPFWQYLPRLNDYRAEHVHFMYEKWEFAMLCLRG